jgi:tetratricopeptide (TPR) repeat protein
VVTLPFVLLLMDYWPLGRLPARWGEFRERLPGLVVEKLPFFVPVVAVSVVTVYGAGTAQGLRGFEEIPLDARVGNALLGYGLYLKKMVWPMDLAVIYPLSRNVLSSWPVILAAMVLVAITVWVWRKRGESRYLVVGWSWYVGTLVPVNGLLQSGFQAMADRYAYVPMIGIFIMLSWGAEEFLRDRDMRRRWLAGVGGCVLLTLGLLTRVQLSYWQDTTTLFEHTLRVTSDNYMAHYFMATGLYQNGEFKEAVEYYQEALKINSQYSQAHHNLGVALVEQGRVDEAIEHLEESLRIRPQYAQAHYNLGVALVEKGRVEAAIEHFSRALEIDPQLVDARRNLVFVVDEAIAGYRRALQPAPDNAQMHNNLGVLLLRKGEVVAASHHFSEAVRIDPNDRIAQENLDRTQSTR